MQYKKIKPLILAENAPPKQENNEIFHGKSFVYVEGSTINCGSLVFDPAMKIRFVRGCGSANDEVGGEIEFYTVDISKLAKLSPGHMVELEVIVRPINTFTNKI